jgi:hypothetical protein
MPSPKKVTPPPRAANPHPGFVKKYGFLVPDGTPLFALELKCYRENVTPEMGGLGAEQHFKNAWKINWPDYEWNDWVEMLVHSWCNYKWISVIGHERAGKCLRRGTEVLLFDGSIVKVEDVKEGMLLMGDDSTPRRVLSLARGREMMYSIKSSRGGEWGCNESHILSFKCSRDIRHRDGHFTHRAGEVIELPVRDFLKKGMFWRSVWKQYQVSADFPETGFVPPVDPYIYGAWLADGGFDTPSFCKPRGPMTERWVKYWEGVGARITVADEDRCPNFFVRFRDEDGCGVKRNYFTRFIRTCTVTGEKRVRRDYLVSSRECRSGVLAGLLDGDGSAEGNKFCITTKYPGLAKDICFLARSLGLYASDKPRIGKIKSTGFVGHYRSVYISGDFSKVPTIQKFAGSNQSNDPLCQSITATPTREDEYFGFELDGNRRFLLGDFTVTHNTYCSAHIAWLDYQANPFETLTSLTTVTFEGLKLRMWSDVLRASETSRVKQPFQIRSSTNEMRVYPQEASKEAGEKYQIHGMAVNHTKDAEGRIRGGHAPRRRIFLDEAQDIASAIYEAMINPMSAPDAKCVMLSNPVEKVSKFGDWCEPEGGWSSVHDTDLFWKTKKGGICLHFDGLQSPNVIQNKRIFTGLLTRDNVEEIKRIHGENSVQWWALIRGWFPPDGLVARIFPSQIIEKCKPPIVFDFATEPVATLDPAFEEDACPIHFGDKGKLRDGRVAISATETIHLKFTNDPTNPKDYQLAHQVMELCKKRGVQPKNFIMDKSGGGRGVFAILQKEWSPDVQGIDYGGASTDRPLRSDETEKCSDIFKYFVTELWYRARAACEDGILAGASLLHPLTIDDLYSRRYSVKQETQGTVQIAERKTELKSRLGRSPDDGDAFVQFAELLIREGHGPGRAKQKVGISTKWQRQRTRAVQASKQRHSEASEFAH